MSATASQPRGRGAGAKLAAAPEPTDHPEPSAEERRDAELAAMIRDAPEGARLDAAILAITTQAGPVLKNATGLTGKGGSREYGYADLDSVLKAIVPVYTKWQISFRAWVRRGDDGLPELAYRFSHIPSGETLEDVCPLVGAVDSQSLGSAITYLRRYIQLMVLNLAPGDDDDGAGGRGTNDSVRQISPGASAAAAQASGGPRRGDGQRMVSVAQKQLVKARARDGHLGSVDLVAILMGATGRQPVRYEIDVAKNKLSMEIDRLPMAAVDEVLAGIAARAVELEHEAAQS